MKEKGGRNREEKVEGRRSDEENADDINGMQMLEEIQEEKRKRGKRGREEETDQGTGLELYADTISTIEIAQEEINWSERRAVARRRRTDEQRQQTRENETMNRRIARQRRKIVSYRRYIACAVDIQEFDETIHDVTHTLSKGSLFDCPKCLSCGAYSWKEEIDGFCCSKGRVKLQYNPLDPKPGSLPPQPPQTIKDLFKNPQFVRNARNYNNALAMASVGMKEVAPPGGGFNPGLRIQGKMHHFIGSLFPESDSTTPTFAQLYVYDPENELRNRKAHTSNQNLDEDLLKKAQEELHKCNSLIKEFKTAVEILCKNTEVSEKYIYLSDKAPRSIHPGTTNLPGGSDIAVILPGPTEKEQFGRLHVQIQLKGGGLKIIDSLHPLYDPLAYVLLYPEGHYGYHLQLGKRQLNGERGITATDFYRYHLQIRDPQIHFNLLLRGGKLSMQFVCDQQAKIEGQRLEFLRYNQKTVKAERYKCVQDAISSNDEVLPGKITILPSTLYGSPRWFTHQFQDAMAIVREKGKPDIFLTFTCNPRWPEILQSLFENEEPRDRPDIIAY